MGNRMPMSAERQAELSLATRKRYWRSLTRHDPALDPRLYPGIIEELQAALRNALVEIPDEERDKENRGAWFG